MIEIAQETTRMDPTIKEHIIKIQQGIVPEGYKKTGMGIIPVEWEVQKLKDIINKSNERYSPNKNKQSYQCIELEHIDPETGRLNGYTSSSSTKSSKVIFYKSDVLYGRLRPYLKKYYYSKFKGVCSTEIWVLRPSSSALIPKYLFYLVQTDYFDHKANISTGSSMPRADWDYVSNVYYPIPSKKEQQKISNILSTWDKAIKYKESLIEEKANQKKGLMQKMIKANERWTSIKLKDVLYNRNDTGYEELELLAVTRESGVIKRDELDRKDTSSSNKERYKLVLPNDIVYNTMRMWQGVSGLSKCQGIVSPAYTVLKPNINQVDALFVSYMFKLPGIINIFRRYSQGLVKDTLSLRYSVFGNISLEFPPLSKQRRIAKILSTADREIELLKQEVELLKEQKRGLMQLLLTGIVRVGGVEVD